MAKFIQTMYLLFCYPDEDVKKFFNGRLLTQTKRGFRLLCFI